ADVDHRRGIGYRLAGLDAELRIFGEPPEEGMAVQEELHSLSPRNAAMIPSGRGSSKSGAIRIRPLSRPGLRGSAAIRTSFAMGRPLFAMMISSPCAARSRRRER